MALDRYVLTATVTVPAGSPATVTAAEPGTGGAAGYGNAGISAGYAAFPQTFIAGTAIILDPAGPLYAAIGADNLRAYQQGTDDVSHAAISNQGLLAPVAPQGPIAGCEPVTPQASKRAASKTGGPSGCELARRGGTARRYASLQRAWPADPLRR